MSSSIKVNRLPIQRRRSNRVLKVCGLAASAAAGSLTMVNPAVAAPDTYTWLGTGTDWTSPATGPATWTSLSAGTNNLLFPSQIDDVATFDSQTSNRTLTLNNSTNYTNSIIVGALNFTTGTTATAFVLNPGLNGTANSTLPLIFQSTSTSGASLTALIGAAINVNVNVDIQLNSDTTIGNFENVAANRILVIGSVAATSANVFNLNNQTLHLIPSTSSVTTNNNSIITIGSKLTGTGSLTVDTVPAPGPSNPSNTTNGGAVLRLQNVLNDFVGKITVNGDQTLQIQIAGNQTIGAIGSPSLFGAGLAGNETGSLVLNNGGTIDLAPAAAINNFNRLFSLGGTGGAVSDGGNATTSAVHVNSTGAVGFFDAGTKSLTLTGGAGAGTTASATNVNTFTPAITNNGTEATSLIKGGAGSWLISAASGVNTYTGATTIQRGILFIGANNALSTASLLTMGNNTQPAVFDLNGFNQTVAGMNSPANTSAISHIVQNTGTNTSTLTMNVANAATNRVYRGIISGNINLVKTGNGIETLGENALDARAYNITGTTTVTGGTLRVGLTNGTAVTSFTTASVSVSSGAGLGGSGSIAAPVTIAGGGHVAPGNSAGTLTVTGGTTVGNGSFLDYDLDLPGGVAGGTSNDLFNVLGTFSIGTGISVNITGGSTFALGVSNQTYHLIQTASAVAPDFTGWTASASNQTLSGVSFGVSTTGGNFIDITLSATAAVPEPMSMSLIGLGGLGLLMRRRRRLST